MELPELVTRGRQESFKWIERLSASAAPDRAWQHDPESLSRFVRNSEKYFFEGPFDPRLPAELATRVPRHREELLASAEEIYRGRMSLLGYRDLDLGDAPDWHFDPIANRRAPLLHWSELDPLDHSTVGDSKVIWEMNRHQWLIQLGQSYRLTRDERYADAVARHLRSWLRANPPGMGINWASSLEVAFRLIAWCWTLLLIRDSRALTVNLFAELLASVRAHATHVERYLSHYFSPNTHLTGEALGLFYAGLLFPELNRAARWRSIATEILVQQIDRQVLSDGVYFERSTCYQRYTVDIYLHFLILARRAGLEVPPLVSEAVRSMLDVLVTLRQPDGSMPSIGDADGGRLLPLSRTRPDDFQATFSTAAVVFQAPEYAWAAGGLAPETLWLFGTSAAASFQAIVPSPPASGPCRIFPAGGFAAMRSGWEGNGHSLIFDTGPLGCPVSSGHGHADLLSIQCAAFGQQYLVDAGTGCYTGDAELRDFFRGTAAHSTVMVDGKSQAQPAGPFAWQSRCAAQLRRWTWNDDLAFADAEHDGYRTQSDSVSHRRRVVFIKSRYWLVIDDLTGSESHSIEVRFQFAPMHVQIDIAGWVRATPDDRHGLLLRAYTSVPFEVELREGRRAPTEGWVSPNYGQLEPAPVVVYRAVAPLPVRILTLLWPTEQVEETPRVDVIRDAQGRPSGFRLERGETVTFGDGEPLIQHQLQVSRPERDIAGIINPNSDQMADAAESPVPGPPSPVRKISTQDQGPGTGDQGPERQRRMREVLHHRGPGGEGVWINSPLGRAHRRLAIGDIVESGSFSSRPVQRTDSVDRRRGW